MNEHKENFETIKDENKSPESDNLSIDSISRVADDLKKRIEDGQRLKEENLNKQLSNRETLILEQKNNDELILKAQEAVDYFGSLDQANLDLLNDQDKEQLKNLKEILDSLEKQRQTIDEKINAISDNPEVFSKVYDSAVEEDKTFKAKKQYKETVKQLESEIDNLINEIKGVVEKTEKQKTLSEIIYREKDNLVDSINALFRTAINMAKNAKNNIMDIGGRVYDENKDLAAELSDLRKKLGIFDGKDKAAIDFLLAKKDKFNDCREKIKEYKNLEDEIWEDKKGLVEKYKEIIEKAIEADKNFPDSDNQTSFILWSKMRNYGINNKDHYNLINNVLDGRA
jgi:hypothetical protein